MRHYLTASLPRKIFNLLVMATLLATLVNVTPQAVFGIALATPAANLPEQAADLLQYTAGGHVLGFASDKVYLASLDHALTIEFVGGETVRPVGRGAEGAEMAQISPLGKVTYPQVWPGIDVVYTPASDGVVESSYLLDAGADVSHIHLCYNVPVELTADGRLRFVFETGFMTESAPVAWQEMDGQRIPVEVRFALSPPRGGAGACTEPCRRREGLVGFSLGDYDPAYPLVIDPAYDWHIFMGASSHDYGYAIAVDGDANVYLGGYSGASWNGPSNESPLNAYTGGSDLVVVKLNSSGAYQWHTFYGSASDDYGYGLAVDGSDNVYLGGHGSSSWDGPSSEAPLHTHTGNYDLVVLKLNSSGAYQWHTFYGSSIYDRGYALAVDGSDNVHIGGYSYNSWDGPSGEAPLNAFAGTSNDNLVVLKLNSSGAYQWHTFYGSENSDVVYALAVDGSENVYLGGYSHSSSWNGPSGQSPLNAYAGSSDMVVVKLNSSGAYQWHTFYGSGNYDECLALAVDGSEYVYLGGRSDASWNGPPDAAPLNAYTGFWDLVLVKLNSSGAYQWHTFYGSSSSDYGYALAVDGSGDVYLGGFSYLSWNGPSGESPLNVHAEKEDMALVKLNSSGAYQWHTFYGSASVDKCRALAVDGDENIYLGGYSDASWNGPWTQSPLNAHAGGDDLVVVKMIPAPDLTLAKSVTPGTAAPGDTITYTITFSNTGDALATGVVITDVVPVGQVANLSYVSSGVAITDTGATPPYVWDVADLAVGQGGVITVTGQLSATLAAGVTFTNTAVITTTVVDSDPGNNSSDAGVTVIAADLVVIKAVSPITAAPGDSITYTITFSNTGDAPAAGVIITDVVPVGQVGNLSYVSSGVAITDTGASPPYVWEVADLAVGQGGVITITGQLSATLATSTFTNTAVITTTAVEADTTNNSSDAAVTVIADGTIVIGKVTNPAGGTGFQFTNDIPGGPSPFNLDDGQSRPFDDVPLGSYTVTETDPIATPGGYILANLNCVESDTNNSFGTVGTRTATINLEAGETVTCTFTNEVDTDGDGVPDSVEGSGDRDGDDIPNNEDYDPTGYFYDQITGQIIPGGQIAVTGSGVVAIVHDGSNGYYQFSTDGTAGTYTVQVTLPPGYGWSDTCLRQGPPPFDPTGGLNPTVLGNGEDGDTGFLTSSACTAFYLSFDLAVGDPVIFNNNFPIGELFTLTVNTTGAAARAQAASWSGTVTSDPAGINCGDDCQESYPDNTPVALTAHPGLRSYFVGWGGDCDANGQVIMDSDKSCTAAFGYPVGGVVVPVDKLELVASWLGLATLAAAVGAVVVWGRRGT